MIKWKNFNKPNKPSYYNNGKKKSWKSKKNEELSIKSKRKDREKPSNEMPPSSDSTTIVTDSTSITTDSTTITTDSTNMKTDTSCTDISDDELMNNYEE